MAIILVLIGGFVYLDKKIDSQKPEKSAVLKTSTEKSKSSRKVNQEKKSSPSTEESKSAPASLQMDIDAIQKNNYSSVSGTWKNLSGDDVVITDQGLMFDKIGCSVSGKVSLSNGWASEIYDSEPDFPAIIYTSLFYVPRNVIYDRSDYNGLEDRSKDRIIIYQGTGIPGIDAMTKTYYRESEIANLSMSVVRGTLNNLIMPSFNKDVEACLNSYRYNLNLTLKEHKDYIKGDFVEGSESYQETIDWLLSSDEARAIESYDSLTLQMSNVKESSDTVTCDVEFGTVVHYTDGTQSHMINSRSYIFKRQGQILLIEKF